MREELGEDEKTRGHNAMEDMPRESGFRLREEGTHTRKNSVMRRLRLAPTAPNVHFEGRSLLLVARKAVDNLMALAIQAGIQKFIALSHSLPGHPKEKIHRRRLRPPTL